MRGLIVALLVALGGLLSVPAAIAVWGEREILDEDRFVATTDEVFADEDVQVVLAARLTDAIMTRAEIQERIGMGLAEVEARGGERLPQGLALLEAPLTRVARETIYRLVLRALEAQPLAEVRDAALRGAHQALIALIEQKGPLEIEGSQVILNLQPIIESVIEELAGERGTEFLQNLDLPEDTGQVVITEEANHPALWTLARRVDDINPVIPIVTAIVLVLAIAISRNRRRTTITVGATVAVVAGLAVLVLTIPVKELATGWPPTPEGRQAAEATYDILVDSFRRQELFVVLFGLGISTGGSLAGDSKLRRFIRSRLVRDKTGDGEPTFIEWVRGRAVALRLAGLAAGALFIALWPDPSTRLTITVLALLVSYLAALWVATSDAEWAQKTRERIGASVESPGPAQREPDGAGAAPAARWLARRAAWLRLLGVAAAAIALIVLPFSYGAFLAVVVLLLLYLAAIDLAVNSTR